jgi:hypothetical protein
MMPPLPLVRTPSLGCHAGPSPPEPLPDSILSLLPGSKIASSLSAAKSGANAAARHTGMHSK